MMASARSDPVAEFFQLNPEFARPAGASQAKQWGRVRGREAIETLGPRVVAAWFEENQQPQQQRFAAITRRGRQAVAQSGHHRRERQAEQRRSQAVAERTRQQLTSTRARSAPSSTRRPDRSTARSANRSGERSPQRRPAQRTRPTQLRARAQQQEADRER